MTDVERVRRLFYRKLAAEYPDHPWLKRDDAREALSLRWKQPRRVDQWYWMDLEIITDDNVMIRYGRVSWNADGTGYYDVSITYQHEHGCGLYCWPSFRALSDAQEFVERLMIMPLGEARKIHGTQWPGVVL